MVFPGFLNHFSKEYADQYGKILNGVSFVFIAAAKWFFTVDDSIEKNGLRMRGDNHRYLIYVLVLLAIVFAAVAPAFLGNFKR